MDARNGRVFSESTVLVLATISMFFARSAGSVVQGRQFYLGFPEHPDTANAANLDIFLVVSNPAAVTVRVEVLFPKMASVSALSYDIPPKGYWKTAIDHRLQLHGSSKQSKGVNVVADNLVEVQVISELTVGWRSKGSYMSLPVELLSDDYVIATLCELNNCFCAIVLTQDGTDVSISLRVPTGDAVVYEGVTYGNDDVITASGDRGDVIQVTCYECDLSGTRVRSSHDIAVIAGGQFTNGIQGNGKDMVVKQFLPWKYSGNRYLLSTDLIFSANYEEIVKIVASTQFHYKGSIQTPTYERQVFEFKYATKTVAEVVASDRVLVAQFFEPKAFGDQIMQLPLPVASWQTSYDVFAHGDGSEVFSLVLVTEEPTSSIITATKDGGTSAVNSVTTTSFGSYSLVLARLETSSQRLTVQCPASSVDCRPFSGFIYSQESDYRGWSVPLMPDQLAELEITTSPAQTTYHTTERETTIHTTEQETTLRTTEPETTIQTTEQATTIRTTERETTLPTTERDTTLQTTDLDTTRQTTEQDTSFQTTEQVTSLLTTDKDTTAWTTGRETTQTTGTIPPQITSEGTTDAPTTTETSLPETTSDRDVTSTDPSGTSTQHPSTANSQTTTTVLTQTTPRTASTTSSVGQKAPKMRQCPCKCMFTSRNQTTPSKEQIEELAEEIKNELTVNPSEQSQAKRKKISVWDSRTSSVTSGTAAMVLLAFVFGCMALSDILSVLRFCSKKIRRRLRRQRQPKCE